MGKGASSVCFSLKKGKKKRHPLFLFMTLLVFSFFKKSESEVSRVQLFATPWTVAYHALPYGIFQARVLEWVAVKESQSYV